MIPYPAGDGMEEQAPAPAPAAAPPVEPAPPVVAAPASSAPRRRGAPRWVWLLGGAVMLLGAGVGGWYGWRWDLAPVPPPVELSQAPPDIPPLVCDAIGRVRGHPYSAQRWGR